jgi:hypothetical protein
MRATAKGKRRTRRWITLGLIAVAVTAIGAATTMAAVTTHVTIKARISPNKLRPASHPTPIKVTVQVNMTDDPALNQPPTLDKAIVYFPQGTKQYGNLFPSCSAAILDSRGDSACPKGSKVGSGTASGSIQLGTIHETLQITIFNGPHGKSVLSHVQGFNPLLINQTVVSPLVPQHGKFAYKLTVPLPPNLQQINPGQFSGVNTFKVTVGATRTVRVHGKKVTHGWAEDWCPKSRKYPVHAVFTFISDGIHPASDPTTADTNIPFSCIK